MKSHPFKLLRGMQLPRNAGKTLQELAALEPTARGSVTQIKELTPIRLATQRALSSDERWSGFPLTSWAVGTSLYGGPHYRLSLYSDRITPQQLRAPDDVMARIPVFVVRWSCTHEQLYDAAFRAQVEATAAAYMDMLNMRRDR